MNTQKMAACVRDLFLKTVSTFGERINTLQVLILNYAFHKHQRYLPSSALFIKPSNVTVYLTLNPMCLCKTMDVKMKIRKKNTFAKYLLKASDNFMKCLSNKYFKKLFVMRDRMSR